MHVNTRKMACSMVGPLGADLSIAIDITYIVPRPIFRGSEASEDALQIKLFGAQSELQQT